MSEFRESFEAAARALAAVSKAMDEKGFRPPILVGGAAAELYTQSTISTGDFDVVTARQDIFEAILLEHGFIPPKGMGHSIPGWVNPELKMGFEVVGSILLDGHTDNDRIRVFSFEEDGDIAVIPPEDLIADRMGQYASGTAPEMLEQAKILFALCKDLDVHYMEERIRVETGNEYGVSKLENGS